MCTSVSVATREGFSILGPSLLIFILFVEINSPICHLQEFICSQLHGEHQKSVECDEVCQKIKDEKAAVSITCMKSMYVFQGLAFLLFYDFESFDFRG